MRVHPSVYTHSHTHAFFYLAFFVSFLPFICVCRNIELSLVHQGSRPVATRNLTHSSSALDKTKRTTLKRCSSGSCGICWSGFPVTLLIDTDDVASVGYGSHHSRHTPTRTHTCGQQPLGSIRSVCCVGRDLHHTSDPGSLRAALILIRTPAHLCPLAIVCHVSLTSVCVCVCVRSSGRLRCGITMPELVALGDHYH